MDEVAALEISAVRALEMRDTAKVVWTEADRAWASRAAAEVVGEQADPPPALPAARSAMDRLHYKALRRAACQWRPWVAWAIIVMAFALGVAGDRIGGAQRINLLAPPIFALLVWNLGAYVVRGVRGGMATPGNPDRSKAGVPLPAERVGYGGAAVRGEAGGSSASIAALSADWFRLAAPLAPRAARILHFAAATLALG
jgi:hypothetical protein